MSNKNTTIDNNEFEDVQHKDSEQFNDTADANNSTFTEDESLVNEEVEEVTAQENVKSETTELSEEEKLKLEIEVQKDKYLRLFAEFENYKRRTSKERIELFKTAGQEVIQSLLPVLDDFDRALKEVTKSQNDEATKGVELIYNKLTDTLKAKGLEIFNVKEGDVFDADLHEAITQIPSPSPDLKGKIIDVVERGYMLGDKIIRYPKVVTGK